MLLLVILTSLIALVLGVLNGFHDSANSIAAVVSARLLSQRLAVIWAVFFHLIGLAHPF